MSGKMRSSMIAFCVLLTLSVLHVAPAAPVAAGESREVRSDPVELDKDGTVAAWEKRMDPNNKDQSPTNDVHWHLRDRDSGNVYRRDSEDDSAPAPDPDEDHHEYAAPAPAPDVKGRGYVWPGEWELEHSDIFPPKVASNGVGSKGNGNDKGGGGGYAAENLQGSAVNTAPGPLSERPATTDFRLMTNLKNWLQASGEPLKVFRPRNSGSGFVGPPMSELQGTVDSNAARATSSSSEHDLPVRRQGILDKLD